MSNASLKLNLALNRVSGVPGYNGIGRQYVQGKRNLYRTNIKKTIRKGITQNMINTLSRSSSPSPVSTPSSPYGPNSRRTRKRRKSRKSKKRK
jgi:hypothetical protein